MQKHAQLSKYLESGLIAIFHAENQIYEGLNVMIKEASSSHLKDSLKNHQQETEEQINRLKQIAEMEDIELEESRTSEKEGLLEKGKEVAKNLLSLNTKVTHKLTEGLISQGKEILNYLTDSEGGKDLAIVASALLVEEFEVISYKALCVLAKKSENEKIVELLEETLKEEENARDTLKEYLDKHIEKVKL